MNGVFFLVKIFNYNNKLIVEEQKKVEVRLFSSKDKAEDFFVNNSFVFGNPHFMFKRPGWYHDSCLGCSHVSDFVYGSIETIILDDDTRLDDGK